MVEADKPEFLQAIARLTVALREKEPDVVLMRTYFAALHDVEIEFIVAAADRLIGYAEWFPKTSEWRAEAAKIERERLEAQRAMLRKLPAPLCLECDDTTFGSNAEGRAYPCACRKLRRLELLGRRPSPTLPDATAASLEAGQDAPLSPVEAASLKTAIERRTGLTIVPRAMPRSWASKMARRADRDDDRDVEVSNG